jgi:hypothetical protein
MRAIGDWESWDRAEEADMKSIHHNMRYGGPPREESHCWGDDLIKVIHQDTGEVA